VGMPRLNAFWRCAAHKKAAPAVTSLWGRKEGPRVQESTRDPVAEVFFGQSRSLLRPRGEVFFGLGAIRRKPRGG
jgi:hypothetical protein